MKCYPKKPPLFQCGKFCKWHISPQAGIPLLQFTARTWHNAFKLLLSPVPWPETTEMTFNLTAQQPLAPWIPLLPTAAPPWALGLLLGILRVLCLFPFQIFPSAFSASPKFSFWQGPSASLNFYDGLTCKMNVSWAHSPDGYWDD